MSKPHKHNNFLPRALEKISRWSFNGDFGRNFSDCFDLQMWCFGCDIRRKAGNLLLDYGFSRSRPVEGISGSSYYSKQLEADCTIHLWGFAVAITTHECGLCLRRYERVPRFAYRPVVSENAWRPQDIPAFSEPRKKMEIEKAIPLLSTLISQFAAYELSIQTAGDANYRSRCLQGRKKARRLGGRALSDIWLELQTEMNGVKHAVL